MARKRLDPPRAADGGSPGLSWRFAGGAAVAAFLAVAGLLYSGSIFAREGSRVRAAVKQPIAFNHRIHVEQDMACTDCHTQAEKGSYATLPRIKACLLCHEEAQGENPEEPKVREYAEAGHEIPWIQINRLPGHVSFSHEAHVNYAAISCQVCHGPMELRESPVTEPNIEHLDMNRCVACHEEQGASIDCLRCHK